MGAEIYVYGCLETDEDMTSEQKADIEQILDGWDYPAFKCKGMTISFASDCYEGCDPLDDGCLMPLKKLLAYAKENRLKLDGDFDVTSDWRDYDEIALKIQGNELKVRNLQIINADTQELIEELIDRQVLPKDFEKKCDGKIALG